MIIFLPLLSRFLLPFLHYIHRRHACTYYVLTLLYLCHGRVLYNSAGPDGLKGKSSDPYKIQRSWRKLTQSYIIYFCFRILFSPLKVLAMSNFCTLDKHKYVKYLRVSTYSCSRRRVNKQRDTNKFIFILEAKFFTLSCLNRCTNFDDFWYRNKCIPADCYKLL